jgi:polygalacturonase
MRGRINVRNFGALGNGVADDLPAFKSALAHAFANSIGCIYVPPGIYFLNGNLGVEQTLELCGPSSPAWFRYPKTSEGEATLRFAPFCSLVIWSNLNSPGGGNGSHSTLRNLAIEGSHATTTTYGRDQVAVWTSAAKTVGQKFLPTNTRVNQLAWGPKRGNTLEYYYEVVKAGTPAATEPAWQQDVNAGIASGPNETVSWAANTKVFTGTTISIPVWAEAG